MEQYDYPIGPLSELQQIYLEHMPTRMRKRVPIEREQSLTMVLIRVAYKVVELNYRRHVRAGNEVHPLVIIEECMNLETRMAFPYLWWQIRWLGLCVANGITMAQARDAGPGRTFRAQAKTLPNIPRTKW